jgi:hypothetical protein
MITDTDGDEWFEDIEVKLFDDADCNELSEVKSFDVNCEVELFGA